MDKLCRMSSNIINFFFFFLLFTFACQKANPNLDEKGRDELKNLEIDGAIDKAKQNFYDLIYVPIYSDIYVDQQNQSALLAATLSIRNTSYTDSLFVSKIDYFNTEGVLVRAYIDKPISILPMATINYVVEKDDDTGGNGANFIVEINSKNKNAKPLIQAIMIGQSRNLGFAFSTDGYSIK